MVRKESKRKERLVKLFREAGEKRGREKRMSQENNKLLHLYWDDEAEWLEEQYFKNKK